MFEQSAFSRTVWPKDCDTLGFPGFKADIFQCGAVCVRVGVTEIFGFDAVHTSVLYKSRRQKYITLFEYVIRNVSD